MVQITSADRGYGDGEDPQKYHAGLRSAIDDNSEELKIDPATGMKVC